MLFFGYRHNDKNITEDSLLEDIDTILKISQKNIPQESFNALIVIKENIEILKNSPKSLEQIKKSLSRRLFRFIKYTA